MAVTHHSRKKKWILGLTAGLVVLLIVSGSFIAWEIGRGVGEGVLHCNEGNDTRANSVAMLADWGYDLAAFQSRWPEEALTVLSADGTAIPVGVYRPEVAPVGSAILVHGQGGDRLSVAPLAEMYLERGYAVYAMDQRASGESASPLVSFGYFEKDDVAAMVDFAEQQSPQLPVVVHGQSMGAATAAQYAATAHGRQNLDALVLDSSFDNMKHMVLGVMEMDGITGAFFAFCADLYLRARYGFVFGDVDAVKQAADITAPAMIIQCTRDEIAPVEVGRSLFEAVDHPDKVYWEADSDHIEAAIDDPAAYAEQVFHFLKEALSI